MNDNFLHFVACVSDGRKTKVWMVRNASNEDLGAVNFKPTWRKYVFTFNPTLGKLDFDDRCLTEIAEFCYEQTKAWKDSL